MKRLVVVLISFIFSTHAGAQSLATPQGSDSGGPKGGVYQEESEAKKEPSAQIEEAKELLQRLSDQERADKSLVEVLKKIEDSIYSLKGRFSRLKQKVHNANTKAMGKLSDAVVDALEVEFETRKLNFKIDRENWPQFKVKSGEIEIQLIASGLIATEFGCSYHARIVDGADQRALIYPEADSRKRMKWANIRDRPMEKRSLLDWYHNPTADDVAKALARTLDDQETCEEFLASHEFSPHYRKLGVTPQLVRSEMERYLKYEKQ